jgi:hypothetical protein
MIYQLPIPKSPELFERMVCDLLNRAYGTTSFSLYGRKGQNQYGADIVSFEHNIFCQCKLRQDHPKSNSEKVVFIKELIDDANRVLSRHQTPSKIIFATTAKNDAEIQDRISTIAALNGLKTSFEYWSWDYISDCIFLYQNVLNKYFPFRKKGIELCRLNILNKSVYPKRGDNLYLFNNKKRVNQLPIFDFSFVNNSEDTALLTDIQILSVLLPIAKAGTYPKPAGVLKVTKKYNVHLVVEDWLSGYGSANVDLESPIYVYPKSPFRIQVQADKPIVSYLKIKFIFHFNGFELSAPEIYFNGRELLLMAN